MTFHSNFLISAHLADTFVCFFLIKMCCDNLEYIKAKEKKEPLFVEIVLGIFTLV